MPKMRPFDPETDIPVCLMHESSKGRILSKAVTGTRFQQYARSCKAASTLPRPSEIGTKHDFVITTDVRCVTCPACQKTAEFLALYTHQTGEEFRDPFAESSEPIEIPTVAAAVLADEKISLTPIPAVSETVPESV